MKLTLIAKKKAEVATTDGDVIHVPIRETFTVRFLDGTARARRAIHTAEMRRSRTMTDARKRCPDLLEYLKKPEEERGPATHEMQAQEQDLLAAHAIAEDEYYLEACRGLIDVSDLNSEQLAAVESPITSTFWQSQNIEAIMAEVRRFRGTDGEPGREDRSDADEVANTAGEVVGVGV